MDDTNFYNGTSTIYNIEEWLTPTSKASPAEAIQILSRKKKAKVSVTTDLEMAERFAVNKAQQVGGEPIVYIVEPDKASILRVSKSIYSTYKAKIIGEIKYEDFKTKL